MVNKSSYAESINKFINHFIPTATNVIYKALGKDVFKRIELIIDKQSHIDGNLGNFENQTLYLRNFKKGKNADSFGLLIPEELIAKLADVFMGGSGDIKLKTPLSELEINSATKLIESVITNIVPLYNKVCEDEISFTNQFSLMQSTEEKQAQTIKELPFNYKISFILKLNETVEFPIIFLLNFQELKKTLARLGLFRDEPKPVQNKLSHMNLEAIHDIEIPILAELGQTQIPMKYALELTTGSIVELDNEANSEVKLYSNGVEIGTAEIVVVGDTFGIKIKEIIPVNERLKRSR